MTFDTRHGTASQADLRYRRNPRSSSPLSSLIIAISNPCSGIFRQFVPENITGVDDFDVFKLGSDDFKFVLHRVPSGCR